MMPKSLLHQTLAKLISETGRSHLFYFSLNRTHYNRISKLCQAFIWSRWRDSNSRPHAPKARALPAALHRGIFTALIFKRTVTTQRKELYLKLKTLSTTFFIAKKTKPPKLSGFGGLYILC